MVNSHHTAAEAEPSTGSGTLDQQTVPGELFMAEPGAVRCVACAHRCRMRPGQRGACRVRFNREGVLQVPYGYVAGTNCDPVEKKPFFHFYPGSKAFTFGMLGCNFRCDFCQNWHTSQTLRDPDASTAQRPATPEEICAMAKSHGAKSVVSSYNEPLITAEWAKAIFKPAQAAGLACALVSNGYGTSEVLDYLQPQLDAMKVDLKCFDVAQYRRLGGKLDAVTTTISEVWRRGIWLEIVTLLIPDFNNRDRDVRAMARFIASISPSIPWHLTAFHPDYEMTDRPATRPEDLFRAAAIGKEAGLRYVYVGNLAGPTGGLENTWCHRCGTLLVSRTGFRVTSCQVTREGQCPHCQEIIPGRWA